VIKVLPAFHPKTLNTNLLLAHTSIAYELGQTDNGILNPLKIGNSDFYLRTKYV
jgi:hypothetical protein